MAREITLGEMRRLDYKPSRIFWYATLLDEGVPDGDCRAFGERLLPCLTGSVPLAVSRAEWISRTIIERLNLTAGSTAPVPYFEEQRRRRRRSELRCEPTTLHSEHLSEIQTLLPAFVHSTVRQCPHQLWHRLVVEPQVIRGVLASAFARAVTTATSIADSRHTRTYVFARFPLLLEPTMRPVAMPAFAAARRDFVRKVALRQLAEPERVAAMRRALASTLKDAPSGRGPIWAKVLTATGIDAHPLSLAEAIGLTVDERGENAARSLKSRVTSRLREYEFKILANAGLLTPAIAEYLVVEHSLSIQVVQPVLQSIGMRGTHAGDFARPGLPQIRRARHTAP